MGRGGGEGCTVKLALVTAVSVWAVCVDGAFQIVNEDVRERVMGERVRERRG